MAEVAGLVGGGSVLAVLVTVIAALLRASARDRDSYEQAIDRAEARADAAEKRARDEREAADRERQLRFDAEKRAADAALRRLADGGGPW